jgi:type II secretory pathway component PulM
MCSVLYAHFMVEHYRGHHPRAATRADPASARRGESLWRFLPRTLHGSLVSAWRLEAARLLQHRRGWIASPLAWATVLQIAGLVALAIWAGPWALLFWLVLVRPLAAARGTAQADAGAAAARLAQGQALAAAIKARPAANPAAVIDVLNRRLADAGLQPARLEAQGPGQALLEIAAINGRLLIGWATALEQNDGLVIEQLEATRNPDQSVRARLLVRSAQ